MFSGLNLVDCSDWVYYVFFFHVGDVNGPITCRIPPTPQHQRDDSFQDLRDLVDLFSTKSTISGRNSLTVMTVTTRTKSVGKQKFSCNSRKRAYLINRYSHLSVWVFSFPRETKAEHPLRGQGSGWQGHASSWRLISPPVNSTSQPKGANMLQNECNFHENFDDLSPYSFWVIGVTTGH